MKQDGGRKRILVVDDEQDIVDLISHNLTREGYDIVPAFTGEDALELLKAKKPDLMILDLMLPGIQGLDVCREIRFNSEYPGIPILILSARTSEVDRVLGLEMGADDYITKPFSIRELIARIRIALKRSDGGVQKKTAQSPTFAHKDLFIDFAKYDVLVKGRRIDLSPIQMKLLFFLARNPGKVYSRDQLLDQVWGGEVFVTPRNVDVHISRLRKLIERDPDRPAYIVTVTSVGYKFDDSGA